jgi:adenine-specific DNA-methyltransferase
MRYIGCKRRLLPFIHQSIIKHNIEGETFCDLFSGTATVGNYFKQQGYRIIANDLLYSSYVQQYVKIAINVMPSFKKLAKHLDVIKENDKFGFLQIIVDYLNKLKGRKGFIYQHYSPGGTANKDIKRMYFTDNNAKKIDIIREQIEAWRKLNLIDRNEFFILLYALLQEVSKRANTTATQNGFLKHFDKNALQAVTLNLPDITKGTKSHHVYCENSLDLIRKLEDIDILYLDPPYTRKQYATAYHILETVARWDYPVVRGISGMRETTSLASAFAYKREALPSLRQIVSQLNYKHLLLSYSSDSIISHIDILSLLKEHGDVQVCECLLPRYNTMARTDKRYQSQKNVIERLYYLKPSISKYKSQDCVNGLLPAFEC